MATLSSQLILSLIDRASAPSRAVSRAINEMNGRLERNRAQMDEMRGRMLMATGVAYGLVRAIQAPVRSAIAFEEAMADVMKVVDFDTPDGFQQMSDDIMEMSRRLPMAATDIAQIVAAAGQSGMVGSELLEFAEMAAQVGIAFDITADHAGSSLASIKTALGLTVGETRALADAMNYLSNTSASAAPDLVEFMTAVGSAGAQYGFTAEQTVAIGSAMMASGFGADVAATSFRNMGRALARGESATGRQVAAFESLGLSAEDVAKRLQEDAVGTMTDVIERLRELPDHVRASAMSDLFGDEARALTPLITNAALLENALSSVSQQANFLGSSQAEYEVRAQTTSNAMQLFRNQVDALSISIGSALLPALTGALDFLGPIIDSISRFASENETLTRVVIGLTAGLAALRVAAIATRFSFLWLQGSAMIAALGGLRLASVFLSLLNPMALVRGALIALRTAFLFTGIGALIAAVALGGLWIYRRWSAVTAGFRTFGAAFMEAMEPLREALEPVIEWVGQLWEWVSGLIEPAEDLTEAFEAFGTRAGQAVGRAIRTIVDGLRNFPETMGNLARSLREWFATADWGQIGQRIVSALRTGLSAAWGGLQLAWDWVGKIVGEMTGLTWADVGAGILDGIRGAVNLSAQIFSWLSEQIDAIDMAAVGDAFAGFLVGAVQQGIAGIGAAFSFVSGLVTGGGEERGELQSAVMAAFGSLGDLIKSVVRAAFNFGAGFWQGVWDRTFAGTAEQLRAAATERFQAFVDAAKLKVEELIDWFRSLPEKILAAIGEIDIGSLITVNIPGFLAHIGAPSGDDTPQTGGTGPLTTVGPGEAQSFPELIPGRAIGGPVVRGHPYIVGERGPELFVPRASGMIHTAAQTRAMVEPRSLAPRGGGSNAGSAAARPIYIDLGGIVVHAHNADVDAISRELGDRVAFRMRGHFSDEF